MRHHGDHRRLLDRGRKAGLTAAELNASPDCNGNVWGIDATGRLVRPAPGGGPAPAGAP
jgi:hypothetical protein